MESRKPSLFNQLEPHNEDSDSTDISDISEDEDWEDDPPLSPKSQPLEFPKLDHDVPLPRPPSLLSCLLYNNGNNNNNSNNHTNTLHPSNNIPNGSDNNHVYKPRLLRSFTTPTALPALHTPLVKQESVVGISDINVSISSLTTTSSHLSMKNLLYKSSVNLYSAGSTTTTTTTAAMRPNKRLSQPDQLKPSPSSLTSSILFMSQPPDSATTPPPPILPRITTTDSELTDKLINNDELSKSLKESLLIDNRLAKIPLPEKVIDAGIFLKRESRLADEDDFDDYHSKGW